MPLTHGVWAIVRNEIKNTTIEREMLFHIKDVKNTLP